MRAGKLVAAMALVPVLGCGGGGGSTTPTAVAPQTFNAAVSARGNGFLEVHPSLLAAWCCSILTPMQITETGGGKADWTFARMSLFRSGREIERSERGSDYLSAPPDWTKIEPRSSTTFPLFFRTNATDFDDVRITLGFNDRVSGRPFTVDVSLGTFSGVRTSLTPLSREAIQYKD